MLSPTAQEFDEYLTYGGFPQTLEFTDAQAKADYIESVVTQIFDKDIREHSKVRNKEAFDRVLTYVINNFGAPTNFGKKTWRSISETSRISPFGGNHCPLCRSCS